MLTISVAPASARSSRAAGLPDVLAHGDADRLLAQLDQAAGGAGAEVALLVEDAVVGQAHLAIDGGEAAVGEHAAAL